MVPEPGALWPVLGFGHQEPVTSASAWSDLGVLTPSGLQVDCGEGKHGTPPEARSQSPGELQDEAWQLQGTIWPPPRSYLRARREAAPGAKRGWRYCRKWGVGSRRVCARPHALCFPSPGSSPKLWQKEKIWVLKRGTPRPHRLVTTWEFGASRFQGLLCHACNLR